MCIHCYASVYPFMQIENRQPYVQSGVQYGMLELVWANPPDRKGAAS